MPTPSGIAKEPTLQSVLSQLGSILTRLNATLSVAVSNFPSSFEVANDIGSPVPVSDGGSSLTVDGSVVVAGVVAVSNPTANPETGLAKDITLTSGAQKTQVTDTRTLTERMMARSPQANYSLYLDTADVTYIYIAEGPTADTAATTTAQGVRITKDALGNPLGRVQIATGFAWNARSTATWV